MVSNKHFLGVINLYAEVTLGLGWQLQFQGRCELAWGWGLGQQLEQAADSLGPPRPAPEVGSCALPSPLLLPSSHALS